MHSDCQVALQRKFRPPPKGCPWSQQPFIDPHRSGSGLAFRDIVVAFFARFRGFREDVRPFVPRLRYFFFGVEISLRTLVPLFMPESVHSGSAS